MNWLNLRVSTLHSPEYIGSSPVERATFINISLYCAEQENGGKIRGARQWKSRQWQQTCGVTVREIENATKLLAWEGNDLVVWNYSVEKEAEIRARRASGGEGGRRSAEVRNLPLELPGIAIDASSASSSASSTAPSKPEGVTGTEGEGERNEKEKEKEKEKGANGAKGSRPTDEQWMTAVEAAAAYHGIDVRREFGKMQEWCKVRHKQPTRGRFINWLNRIERPMKPGTKEGKPQW